MALVRVVPLKDFLDTALSTGAAGTAYSTVFPQTGERLYSALHLTGVSTDRPFVMTVQAASSSGFAPLTTEITFTLTTVRGSTWQTLAAPSTDRPWRRANWALSTAVSTGTGGTWTGLVWIGLR